MSAHISTGTDEFTQRQSAAQNRRPAWRRRLVDLERGIMAGFRATCLIVVQMFCAVIGLLTGLMLGIALFDWVILIVCFIVALTAELIHQAIAKLSRALALQVDGMRQVECISAAAATLAMCGGIVTSVLLLGSRAVQLWHN
jgi:hypothetical protein